MTETNPVPNDPKAELEAWAKETGIDIKDLPPRVIEALTAGSVSKQPSPKTVNSSRRGFLKQAGLATLGVAGGAGVVIGGATWLGKQGMDAAEPAAKEFLLQEFLERSGVAKEFLDEAVETSKKLASEILDFLVAVKNRVETPSGAWVAAISLWEGLKADAKEWFRTGDKRPDQIIHQVQLMIENDPVLKPHWDKVTALVEEMKSYELKLDDLKTEMTKVDETDAEEAWEIYKKHFWNEVESEFAD